MWAIFDIIMTFCMFLYWIKTRIIYEWIAQNQLRQDHLAQKGEVEAKKIEKKLNLSKDTYALALKCLSVNTVREKQLTTEQIFMSYQAALTVFGIQLALVIFIGITMK